MSTWTISSACTVGSCVEVRHVDGHVEVRDNTAPETFLTITPADWALFLVGAKAGEFDGPAADTAPRAAHRAQETAARNALAEKFLDHLLDHERNIAPAIAGGLAIRLANVVLSAGWQPGTAATPDES